MMTDTKIVIYDLEFTSWEGSLERNWSGENEYREIIQLGAAQYQWTDQKIVELDHLMVYVKPEKNPLLSDYIKDLTGISQENIDQQGIPFQEALQRFHQFCQPGPLPSWSFGADFTVIEENCDLYGYDSPSFNHYDLHTLLFDLGIPRGIHSGHLATHLGLNIEVQAHNALDDVRSLAAVIQYCIQVKNADPNLFFNPSRE